MASLRVNIFNAPEPGQARFVPISVEINALIDDTMSPKAQSAFLASYARSELASSIKINKAALGSVPRYETFVDGQQSTDFEKVRPQGFIVIEFELLQEMFAWIGAELVQHSPVGGPPAPAYIENHLFFADGQQVSPGAPVPTAKEYVFVNAVPYARKIERGESAQAPDGVYQAVAAIARARFGKVAKIQFDYVNMIAGAKSDRQPAIVITAR